MEPSPYGTLRMRNWVIHAGAWGVVRNRIHYEQLLQRTFRKYDADNSGFNDRNEFIQVIREMLEVVIIPQTDQEKQTIQVISEDIATEMLLTMDEDGSDEIDYNEFKAAVRVVQRKHKEIKTAMKTASTLSSVQDALTGGLRSTGTDVYRSRSDLSQSDGTMISNPPTAPPLNTSSTHKASEYSASSYGPPLGGV